MNKTTNLSKELQFFEKVRASVHSHAHLHACMHACMLEYSSAVTPEVAEASIALCVSIEISAALSPVMLRCLLALKTHMIITCAQVQAAITYTQTPCHNSCRNAGEAQNAQQGAVSGLPQVLVAVQRGHHLKGRAVESGG